MGNTDDFVVCMVFETEANCSDRGGPDGWVTARVDLAGVNYIIHTKRGVFATEGCMKRFRVNCWRYWKVGWGRVSPEYVCGVLTVGILAV